MTLLIIHANGPLMRPAGGQQSTKIELIVNLKTAKSLGDGTALAARPRRQGDRMKRQAPRSYRWDASSAETDFALARGNFCPK
jgi:hypothetical protein